MQLRKVQVVVKFDAVMATTLILLKLINSARQAAAFSQRLAVAFGYGGFKKKPEAIQFGRAGL